MKELTQKSYVKLLRIVYPFWALIGMFGLLYIPSVYIVPGDPVATSQNIASGELLFRFGILSNLITQLVFIIAALLLYKLFESVNINQSRLMVVFAFIGVPIAMMSELANIAALYSLEDAKTMEFFLELNSQGITIASIFWGLWLFPLGYLIYISGYFPKFVGNAVILGGIGYILGSSIGILLPTMESLKSIVEILTFGELVFIIWIIVTGAKLPN